MATEMKSAAVDIAKQVQTSKKKYYTKGRSMDLAHIFLQYFFGTEYMHFGYWEETDDINFLNLKKAQERYVKNLFVIIPPEVKTILDVGCGSGKMAADLTQQGYQLDTVAPPCVMTSMARQRLDQKSTLFELKFEDLAIANKYDLVLFSESFQFVNLRKAILQAIRYSKKYILIADVFRKMPERGPIGGGHQYNEFLDLIKEFNLIEVKNIDVTKQIAPTFDLELNFMQNFVNPLLEVLRRVFRINSSLLAKLLLMLNKKKLKKLNDKYLASNNRNAASFNHYKRYCFVLLEIPQR